MTPELLFGVLLFATVVSLAYALSGMVFTHDPLARRLRGVSRQQESSDDPMQRRTPCGIACKHVEISLEWFLKFHEKTVENFALYDSTCGRRSRPRSLRLLLRSSMEQRPGRMACMINDWEPQAEMDAT